MKTKIFLIIGSVLGGFLGAWLYFQLGLPGMLFKDEFTYMIPPLNEKNQIEPSQKIEDTVIFDFWQKTIFDASVNTVAVQTFYKAKIIRSGNGNFVSSDGLVVTSYDAAPPGPYLYQVLYDDKIFRAHVVKHDYIKNISLLKIEAENLPITRFHDATSLQSGKDLIITGKFVNISQLTVFSQRALINYVTENMTILDTNFNVFLSGAQVITADSLRIGFVSLRGGKISLVSASDINEFLDQYLSLQKGL